MINTTTLYFSYLVFDLFLLYIVQMLTCVPYEWSTNQNRLLDLNQISTRLLDLVPFNIYSTTWLNLPWRMCASSLTLDYDNNIQFFKLFS